MTNSCLMPAAVVGATSMLLALATNVEAQQVPPDLPAAIICYAEADQSWRVGYLYRVSGDGTAVYMALNGSLTATLDANGVLLEPKDRPAGLDCFGKTLDELRSGGRVMELRQKK